MTPKEQRDLDRRAWRIFHYQAPRSSGWQIVVGLASGLVPAALLFLGFWIVSGFLR